MAIHQEQISEVQGFKKEIEESALGMILENMQVSQYQYPQKSTVRELVSNALDAVREKEIALSILSGKTKVEDHYIQRDEALYKDSNYDPSYYNPQWLWSDSAKLKPKHDWVFGKNPNTVYVTYVDGGDRDKDKLIIEDFGVGLGAKRIEGYFKIGWSSKRNTKEALGKYGIGAKAALSAAPFYTMKSRYNGREYAFQIYPHDIVSITPQFDLENGKSNGVHMFQNGALIYFRETDQPNGTMIEVDAKKHHKGLYLDAVKSQLLYFDNVEFRVKNSAGGLDIIPVKAEIIYEDDYIVLSNNTQYSKPHLLINKVNYGYLDFHEMELEDKLGNIGVKVAAEDVTVNPSRESVIWNEQTRATVVKRFKEVVDIAGNMISKQLKVDDIIEWIKACSEIEYRFQNSDSIIGRLSRIVDLNNTKIRFSRDERISYGKRFLDLLDIRTVLLEEKREGSSVKYHIKRIDTNFPDVAEGKPIITMTTGSSFAKDKYLLQKVYPNGFISVRLRQFKYNEDGEQVDGNDMTAAMHDVYNEIATRVSAGTKKTALEVYEKLQETAKVIEQYIMESQHIIPYDTVVVPDDYDGSDTIEVVEDVKESKEAKMSLDARRKLEGTMPIYTPRVANNTDTYGKGGKNEVRLYDWQKVELPVANIDEWDEEEVFYATDKVIGKDNTKDVLESELLHLAALFTRPANDKSAQLRTVDQYNTIPAEFNKWINDNSPYLLTHFITPKIKLIKIAQERRKYFLDFKPIQRFFLDIKNKVLTMSNALIRWNTARVMHEHFEKLRFLENYELFHYKHCTTYRNLKKYVETNYREVGSIASGNNYYGVKEKSYEDLINHCDKVMKLQLLVREHKSNPELIAKVVTDMFNPEQEVIDGCAVDITLYDQLMELVEYAAPISTLLNELYVLTFTKDSMHKSIPEKLEHAIKEYLTFKGVEMQ